MCRNICKCMKYFSVLFFWEHGFFLHGRQTDHKHLKYVSSNWPICLALVPHLVALAISPASRLPLFLPALALPKQEASCIDSVSPLNVTNSQAHARICRIGRGAEDSEVLFVLLSLVIATYHSSSSHRLWAAQHLSFRSSNFSRFELWKSLAFTCEVCFRPQTLRNSIYSVDPEI